MPNSTREYREEVQGHFAFGGRIEYNSGVGWSNTRTPRWNWTDTDYRIPQHNPNNPERSGNYIDIVLYHFRNGGRIQIRCLNPLGSWRDWTSPHSPNFNWDNWDFRIITGPVRADITPTFVDVNLGDRGSWQWAKAHLELGNYVSHPYWGDNYSIHPNGFVINESGKSWGSIKSFMNGSRHTPDKYNDNAWSLSAGNIKQKDIDPYAEGEWI